MHALRITRVMGKHAWRPPNRKKTLGLTWISWTSAKTM